MEKQMELLRNYVSSSEPEVNKKLRKGGDATSLKFDDLFSVSEVPKLYRCLPNEWVKLVKNSLYRDLGYMSFSDSFDKLLSHYACDDLACFILDTPGQINCIKVKDLLPDFNDEGEHILPASYFLKCENVEEIQTKKEIDDFARHINGNFSYRDFLLYDIKKLTIYTMKKIDSIEEYIQLDLPFYHICETKDEESILQNGLLTSKSKSKKGICVFRECEFLDDMIGEIIDRQLHAIDSTTNFSLIKLTPSNHEIEAEDIAPDLIPEPIAPLCNYICKDEIKVSEDDVIKGNIHVGTFKRNKNEVIKLTGYKLEEPPFADNCPINN